MTRAFSVRKKRRRAGGVGELESLFSRSRNYSYSVDDEQCRNHRIDSHYRLAGQRGWFSSVAKNVCKYYVFSTIFGMNPSEKWSGHINVYHRSLFQVMR
jgi:hypothetical protein